MGRCAAGVPVLSGYVARGVGRVIGSLRADGCTSVRQIRPGVCSDRCVADFPGPMATFVVSWVPTVLVGCLVLRALRGRARVPGELPDILVDAMRHLPPDMPVEMFELPTAC